MKVNFQNRKIIIIIIINLLTVGGYNIATYLLQFIYKLIYAYFTKIKNKKQL